MSRKIRMGMVGGGVGAFIGGVHRCAALIDGEIELVCGAFSSTTEKSKESGQSLHLPDDRIYANFEEMINREKNLPESKRIDFVSIVTPNHMHYAPAKMALENGFHVMCDKPVAFTLNEAKSLASIVKQTGLIFGLTHNYTGYPMVKEARRRVKEGLIGKIRKVVVEYPQAWLSERIEETGYKQATWRTDPSKSGKAGCMGDIGTHAENLMEYITGLKIVELCADLTTFVPGRELDDDGNVLCKLENGAKAILFASQISVGDENNLRIRIYGDKGGLEWYQPEPNTLYLKWLDRPTELFRSGNSYVGGAAAAHSRLPFGHPEGFIEAFANLYRNYAFAIRARIDGTAFDAELYDFPTIEDGIRGMEFIDAVVASSASDKKWTKFN
ncbi:MAG: Gfo/Idh/MocA family oxidoreductase [Bacteroidetes bacterium]|nr:Gfo/Idh/MocA family oxidoreductase [Bacteroidota bacterium]MDA1121412.1 Gfo/Idh/MocA family oxidoreductase [Bacteroidota bacterium]